LGTFLKGALDLGGEGALVKERVNWLGLGLGGVVINPLSGLTPN